MPSDPHQVRRRRADLHDWVQEACIARARELGLSGYEIAHRCNGGVSEKHVQDFLARRSSMGSHKLQHILGVLGLTIRPDEGIAT